jgi:predicted RNA-binding Zn ribbon-like protein
MEFLFVSGSVALDFAGTVEYRRDDPLDRLTIPADLAAWTVASGALDTAATVTAQDLAAAIEVREAVYRLALATVERSPYAPDDCATVNRAAAANPVRAELRPDGSVRREGALGAVLSMVARDAVGLIEGPPGLLKECAAPTCTRLYVDRSHRASRRWCDMARCGNRAKAAGYRARRP